MASSSRFQPRTTKVRLGDMDTPVKIYKRNIKAPVNTKYNLNIELVRENVWTMWETRDVGVELFDGVNKNVVTVTDLLRIHYDTDFRDFDYVEYNDMLYEIVLSDWLDPKNKEFVVLYCVLKGDKTKSVNIL